MSVSQEGSGAARRRLFRRSVVLPVAALAVLGLAACDPPPAPDGRDLGVVIDSAAPVLVEKGSAVELGGSISNYGTVAASGVTFDYGVTGGFTVDEVDLGSAGVCGAVSATHMSCTLAEQLAPGASVAFTTSLTAGGLSGSFTHVLGVGSDGTEATPDVNPGHMVFPIEVRPSPAGPSALDIGNGTNYLGTGQLLATAGVEGHPSEGVYLSVNPYCTAKENGDRYQSGYLGICSGSPNSEYRSSGYTYTIDVPAGRTRPIDVLLWDARYDTTSAGAIDMSFGSQGTEPFTYTLYGADATPTNDNDNPVVCSRVFGADTAFDYGPYLGSERWHRLCSISSSAPAGRYLLRVQNSGSASVPVANGTNHFGIVAAYAGTDASTSLCDVASRPECPTVRGEGVASIYINQQNQLIRVPLGSVDASHEGRRLRIELFDPGEGMERLRVLAPSSAGTLVPMHFEWRSDNALSGSGTSLDVRQSRFNGRVVTIDVDLTGYQPPSGTGRWMVEYLASGTVVTDRTTWVAGISDHPAP